MGSETRARLALGGLLAATLLAFELLFAGDGHVGPAIVACLLATAVSALARRWGAGPILTFELSLAALFWYLTLVFQMGNSFFGVPTPASAAGLTDLVSSAAEASLVDYAPIPVRAGYVIMIVVGFWLATTIAEVATFRWRRPVVASLPALVLFAVAMIVGTGVGTVFFLSLFLIALLTFWASESSHRLRSWGRWVSPWDHKPAEAQPVTGALARRMGASCIAVTLVAPLFLPTLGDGWIPWRNDTGSGPSGADGDDGGDGGEVNLLVDIAPQLLEQSDTEMFTVTAKESAYWRLASLVEYDGRLWHQLDDARTPAEGDEFPSAPPGATMRLEQTYEISGLEGEFLPAAVQPIEIEDATAKFVPESVDLETDQEVDEDLTYTVTSAVVNPTYEELVKTEVDEAPSPEYTYPGEVSGDVDALLAEWTRGAKTDFEKLVAIQDHLRSSDFVYSTEVEQNDDSEDYLGDFLLNTRAGFCQQFSTAFALLARRLGFPARVSVGFLPGSARATADGFTYTVRGTDAHAWPEVKFERFGWVAFEPTGRAESALPEYTISPSLLQSREGLTGGAPGGGRAPDGPDPRVGRAPSADPPTPEPRDAPVVEPAWEAAFGRLALVGLLFIAGWAVVVPTLKRQRTKRRYRRARTPADVAIAAFMHFEDDASEMLLPRSPAESARAYAERLRAEGHRVPPRRAERLAALYEAAAYSPTGVTGEQAAEARRVARELATALWARASLWQKAARLFSVRSLIGGPGLRLRLRLRPAT